jgi:hypothetical protein
MPWPNEPRHPGEFGCVTSGRSAGQVVGNAQLPIQTTTTKIVAMPVGGTAVGSRECGTVVPG